MAEHILQNPPGPSWFPDCPKCRAASSMQKISEEPDNLGRVITTCECRECGHQVDFADRHPPGVV